jgi:hypothetical protein
MGEMPVKTMIAADIYHIEAGNCEIMHWICIIISQ